MEEAAYWLMAMKAQLKSDVFMRLLRSAYEDYGPALTNKMMTLDPEESAMKTAWKELDAQRRLDGGGGGKSSDDEEEEEGGPAYVQHTNQAVYDDILRRMKNDGWVVVKHYLTNDQQG